MDVLVLWGNYAVLTLDACSIYYMFSIRGKKDKHNATEYNASLNAMGRGV